VRDDPTLGFDAGNVDESDTMAMKLSEILEESFEDDDDDD